MHGIPELVSPQHRVHTLYAPVVLFIESQAQLEVSLRIAWTFKQVEVEVFSSYRRSAGLLFREGGERMPSTLPSMRSPFLLRAGLFAHHMPFAVVLLAHLTSEF